MESALLDHQHLLLDPVNQAVLPGNLLVLRVPFAGNCESFGVEQTRADNR